MPKRPAPDTNRTPAKLRCAIYTRKSSEEGLEQDFNSLDAQREACEAYIASQKREGWSVINEMYDDGGFSGATMERPAFQHLLSDVSAGQISKAEGQRIPAVALETLVIRRIRDWLADSTAILETVQSVTPDVPAQKPLLDRARIIAEGTIDDLQAFVRSSLVRAQVHADRVDVTLDKSRVYRWLGEVAEQDAAIRRGSSETDRQDTTLSIPARLKRTGKEMRLVLDDGSEPASPDNGLVRLLVRANAIRNQLLADRSLTFDDIAKSEGVVPSYATRLFRLTVLAPDIVSAILSGRHPPELTARRLMDDTRLPLDWNEQRSRLGFVTAR
jgi:hypothetical protein